MLICGLEQTLDVAPRFKDDPDILFPTDSDNDYLLRESEKGVWEDSHIRVGLSFKQTVNLKMNIEALEELKQMLPGNTIVEVDCYMLSEPAQENRKERPFFTD